MHIKDSYSAKIMLFGEYSILLGSQALSVPFLNFCASLRIPSSSTEDDKPSKVRQSNLMLREFYHRILSEQRIFSDLLDIDRLRDDLDCGLYLESTIPLKYGVGSSGALCASLYSRYARAPVFPKETDDKKAMADLRQIFISMESFFHGKSSGLDPLVIYLRYPLIISEDGLPSRAYIPPDFMLEKGKIFLVDTGQSRGTSTLVPLFLERYSPGGEMADAGRKLCELNHQCIAHLCGQDTIGFRENLKLLSDFQLQNLAAMIPDHMRDFWSEGLEKDLFSLKLCGSGGGGFLTGFTFDYEKTSDYFMRKHIPVIPVDIDHGIRVNAPHPLTPSPEGEGVRG
jgi:mevalonate kinase